MHSSFSIAPLLAAMTGISPSTAEEPAGSLVQFRRTLEAGEFSYQAEFGRLEVMENRSEHTGTISLAFVRLKSTNEKPGDPLYYLPGSPQPASSLRDHESWAPFLEQRDVVLVDQRGLGESQPRLEWADPSWDPAKLLADEETAIAAMVTVCEDIAGFAAHRGIDLSSYNAEETARDLEELRAAFGDQKIHLMGHSGGSHLAFQYLRLFPQRVASIVSIGTAGPDDIQKPPRESDESLARISELVAQDSGVEYGDLGELMEDALAVLEIDPLPLEVVDRRTGKTVTVELGPFGLQWIVIQDLADTSDLVVLPRLLQSIVERDPSLVQWFAQKRFQQLARIPVALFTSRTAAGASPARWNDVAQQAPRSVFGAVRTLFAREIAEPLGIRDLGDSYRASVSSDVPALFISGTLDAHTPPFQAERVMARFPNSRHLVLENTGHERIRTDPRVHSKIVSFLRGADVESETLPSPSLRFLPAKGSRDGVSHPAVSDR